MLHRPPHKNVRHPALARLERLATLLDTAFRVPGTNFRFGIDSILGLVPGGGDALGLLLSGYLIFEAARLGAPLPVIARMIGNAGLEAAVGTVPVVGDVFDFAWRANKRNVNLLYEHLGETPPERLPSLKLYAVGVLILVLVVLGLLIYGAIKLIGFLANQVF